MEQMIRHHHFEQSGNQTTRLSVYRIFTIIQGQLQYWHESCNARKITRFVIRLILLTLSRS
jgi:hypothetical protein